MKKLFLTLLSLIILLIAKTTFAYDQGDFQYIHASVISFEVKERTAINLEEELAWGDNATDFYYQHSEIGIEYAAYSWLELELAYRHILEKDSDDQWSLENRPHLNAKFKTEIEGYELSNRSRIEFRSRQDREFSTRYSNETAIEFPFEWTKYNIKPFISDDVTVDFDCGELNKNKIESGFEAEITDSIEFELYYFMESTKSSSGEWDTEFSGINTKLMISF